MGVLRPPPQSPEILLSLPAAQKSSLTAQVPCLKPFMPILSVGVGHTQPLGSEPLSSDTPLGYLRPHNPPHNCNPDARWASLTFQVFSKIWTELQVQGL